jgi:hypothetical protein
MAQTLQSTIDIARISEIFETTSARFPLVLIDLEISDKSASNVSQRLETIKK